MLLIVVNSCKNKTTIKGFGDDILLRYALNKTPVLSMAM